MLIREFYNPPVTQQVFNFCHFRDIAYDILEMCMTNLKLTDEPDLSEIVEKIIKHPNARVQTVAVRFVEKNLIQCQDLHNIETLLLFIECLKSTETSIGVPSIQILIDLLSSQNFLNDSAVKQQLLSALAIADETVALRIYSIAVGVARKSPEMLEKMEFLLEMCISDIEKNDLLVMMNVLEVLKDLCLESYGLVYLENKGVFGKLIKKIESINNDPLATILVPGLMKFFGNVAVVFPEKIFNAYPALVSTLFTCILSDDFQLLFTALDTLGYLAKFDDGKRALDSLDGDQCLKVLQHIAQAIPRYPSEIKVRALNCFENVFFVEPADTRNNQIDYICQKWFSSVFGTDLAALLNFCHNPFEDIAMSGFKVLRSLVYHNFGQRGVSLTGIFAQISLLTFLPQIFIPNTGGFVEFLLDRNKKASHDVKQIKYEIIQVLAESNAFDAAITLQLQKYIREGFNYVQAITEVAFESA